MDRHPMYVDEDSLSTFGRRSPWSDASSDHDFDLFEDTGNLEDWTECDDDFEEEKPSFLDQLRELFITIRLEQSKGTAILKLLRQHPCFSSFPADHRTLVNTPQDKIPLKIVEPGEYLHLGVEKRIINFLDECSISPMPESISIDVNTDGANLDSYGFITLWPIQIRIVNIPSSTPIIVGIYKGKKKPVDVHLFMEDFVNETNEILSNGGIMYKTQRIPLMLRCIIADAPTRAMILNHLYHTGYNSCSKCDEAGLPRTDKDYRNLTDEGHHHGPRAIQRLPIDLVKQVIFDYMHLALLGAVKRQTWAAVKGAPDLSKNVKLTAADIHTINARLLLIRKFCPREFSRLPGNIMDYERMKATEFRQLILYTGPVIFHGIYKKNVYDHYLLYHTALRCLVAPKPSLYYTTYARIALEEWTSSSKEIYGDRFMSYNIRNQPHLVDDVDNFGCLDSYSAFPYENNMRIFRKWCKKPHAPLQQLYRRVVEASNANCHHFRKTSMNGTTTVSKQYYNGPLPVLTEHQNILQYKLLRSAHFTLGVNTHDNCCILDDSSICIVRNIFTSDNGGEKNYHLVVNTFDSVYSWFNTGIDSTEIGSFRCCHLNPFLRCIKLNEITAKCYRMPYWPEPSDSGFPSVQPLDDTFIVTVLMHQNS